MTLIVLTVASLGLLATPHTYMCGHYMYEIPIMSQFITPVQCNTVQYNSSAMNLTLRKLIIFQFLLTLSNRKDLHLMFIIELTVGGGVVLGGIILKGVPNILSFSYSNGGDHILETLLNIMQSCPATLQITTSIINM